MLTMRVLKKEPRVFRIWKGAVKAFPEKNPPSPRRNVMREETQAGIVRAVVKFLVLN